MRTHRRAALGTAMLAVLVAVVVIVAAVAFVALSRQPGAAPPSKGPYAVTFEQIGACSPEFWGVPWSVTIGNTTEVQPPGTSLPLDNFSLSGTTNSSLSEITFSLADGTYSYRVSPSALFFTPDSGTFAVSGSNVTVRIAYTGTSCIRTSTTSEGGQPFGSPVEVVSVVGPIPPYNPGGPVVRVTLQNIGQLPITSVNASLPSYPGGPTVPYSFVFEVNSSSPLEPGRTARATLTMLDFGFSTGQEFPLTVSGTLSNGTEFSFTVQVQIVAPGQGTGTSSSESSLVSLCPTTSISSSFGTLTAGTSSPALLCVRLYYYSAAPLTLNLTSALSIQALQYIANGSVNYPRSFSGASNFTVVASQSQLTIGGPDNENEGATVAYGVTANSGSSGTYWLGFLGSSGLTAYALTQQEPLSCGFYGELVAGSGQPNYAQGFNGCITYTTTSQSGSAAASSSAGPTVPGIPYSLMSGYLYFEIVGVTSSTG